MNTCTHCVGVRLRIYRIVHIQNLSVARALIHRRKITAMDIYNLFIATAQPI